jgi:PAS domain-containing protein
MSDGALGDEVREAITRRTRELFEQHHHSILRRIDRLFIGLLASEGLAAIATALGGVPAAGRPKGAPVLLAVGFSAVAITLALRWRGRIVTRHVIAAAQMLIAVMLIHQSGGGNGAQILIFGSLAYLAFYRDWRVLATATLVVAVDHYLYAAAPAGSWPWAEYLGWVAFEVIFLVFCCVQGVAEMKMAAGQQALIEGARTRIEQNVALRAAERSEQADELVLLTRRLKQAEAEARKLAMAAGRTGEALMLTDVLGRIEWINDGFHRLLGYSLPELLGRTPGGFLRSESQDDRIPFWSRARPGQISRAEVVAVAKGGKPRPIAAEAEQLPDDLGMLILFRPLNDDDDPRRAVVTREAGREHATAP